MLTSGFHKRLLDTLSTSVFLLDENLNTLYLNPAAEMLLEVSGKRLKGAPINVLLRDADETTKSLKESLRTGHPFTKREAELKLLSGHKIRVDYTVSPITENEKPALLVEFQARDRLLRISREEEMINHQETSRVLVRGLAHEIKNPLGGIRGAAQLLDRELPKEDLKEYTHIIIEEADRLRNLVDRMLGPNKVNQLAATNIHEVLERVHNLISVESEGQIALIRDYDVSIPEFTGDKEQLIQAFLNITRNAMQVLKSQDRDTPGTITLRTRALRQFTLGHDRHRLVCRIDVIDNGPGIPESMLQSVFYPMVTGRAEGTGLGLSITQSIICQHNGLVECESEPGMTDFIVYIPLEPVK